MPLLQLIVVLAGGSDIRKQKPCLINIYCLQTFHRRRIRAMGSSKMLRKEDTLLLVKIAQSSITAGVHQVSQIMWL